MKYIYGIDFGTSNSVLAILDADSRQIVKVFTESSLLYFSEGKECYIGEKAVLQYISNDMKGRLLTSIKTLLPQTSFTFTYIQGKKYTPQDLVALILIELKKKADDFLGTQVSEVVLGRPVVFSEDPQKDAAAEKRLLEAAGKAGFTNIFLQYEPIAAGFQHEQSISKQETVLIGDFGGGTSDFTLMRLGNPTQQDRKTDIIRTGGVHVGGDDFDSAIMWHKLVPYFGYGLYYESGGKMLEIPVHIFRTLCQWEQMAFLKEGNLRKKLDVYYSYTNKAPSIQRLLDLIDLNLGFSLFQSIEKSKTGLSDNALSHIHFQKASIFIDETLELSEFDRYTNKEVQIIEGFLEQFLAAEGIKAEKIDHVFLTGGSSQLLSIRALFLKKFDPRIIRTGDNFNSVAQGLALSYLHLSDAVR